MDLRWLEELATLEENRAGQFAHGVGSSEARYHERLQRWLGSGNPDPVSKHRILWILHNCIVHPLLGYFPCSYTEQMHLVSSNWLNGKKFFDGYSRLSEDGPQIPTEKRRAWLLHNVAAHIAIGLLPCSKTFKWHDNTAARMKMPGWV